MAATIDMGGFTGLPTYPVPTQYKHLIPSGIEYEPQGNELAAIAAGYKHGRPVLIEGPTGSGKNVAFEYAAQQLGRPLIVLSLAEGTTADQFIGVPMPKGLGDGAGGFTVEWQDGALITAIKAGAFIVLDEVNAADERTLMRLHDFLANGYRLNVYENPDNHGSYIVSPFNGKGEGNGFFMGLTMNPTDSGQYAGTKTLNSATLDRMLVTFLDYLGTHDAEKEASVISRRAKIKLQRATRIVTVMNVIRQRARLADEDMGKDGSMTPLYATASTRRAIDIAILSKDMPIMRAVELGYVNAINRDDRPVVHKLFLDQFAQASSEDEG